MYTPMASEASAVRSQSVASAGQPAPQDEYEVPAATGRRTRADTRLLARRKPVAQHQQHCHWTEGEDGHHGKQHGARVPNGSLRQPHIGKLSASAVRSVHRIVSRRVRLAMRVPG